MHYRICFELPYYAIYIVDCAIDKSGRTKFGGGGGSAQFLYRLHKLLEICTPYADYVHVGNDPSRVNRTCIRHSSLMVKMTN